MSGGIELLCSKGLWLRKCLIEELEKLEVDLEDM
jgi:hypothetical protein